MGSKKGSIRVTKKGSVPKQWKTVVEIIAKATPRKKPLEAGRVQYGTALEFDERQREWHRERKQEVTANLKAMERGADFVLKYVSSKNDSSGNRTKEKTVELKRIWNQYKIDMNNEARTRLSEFKRVMATVPDSQLSKEDKAAFLTRYEKKFKQHLLDDSREQEFYFYLMSGQLDKFNPKDYVSGMFKGDISLSESQGEIQLKKAGGYFRLDYKPLKVPKKELKSGSGLITTLNQAIAYSNSLSELLLREFEASGKVYNTLENKISAMQKYISTSAANFFILGSNVSEKGSNFDALIPKDYMVGFVKVACSKRENIFTLEKDKGALRLKWNGFKDATEAFQVAMTLRQVQIYSYDELAFYEVKGTTRHPGIMSIQQSVDYRRKNINKGGKIKKISPKKGGSYYIFEAGDPSLFIKIHSTYYGGIKYINQYQK
jgi:hypothetical protein